MGCSCHNDTVPLTSLDILACLSATVDLPRRTGMFECHATTTPVNARTKLHVCLFMHDPSASRGANLTLVTCIMWYVKCSLPTDLHLGVGTVNHITTYSDVGWAGCPTLAVPHPPSAPSSALTWCPGPPNARPRCSALVPKRNTAS